MHVIKTYLGTFMISVSLNVFFLEVCQQKKYVLNTVLFSFFYIESGFRQNLLVGLICGIGGKHSKRYLSVTNKSNIQIDHNKPGIISYSFIKSTDLRKTKNISPYSKTFRLTERTKFFPNFVVDCWRVSLVNCSHRLNGQLSTSCNNEYGTGLHFSRISLMLLRKRHRHHYTMF